MRGNPWPWPSLHLEHKGPARMETSGPSAAATQSDSASLSWPPRRSTWVFVGVVMGAGLCNRPQETGRTIMGKNKTLVGSLGGSIA